jgi:hypothetical protein
MKRPLLFWVLTILLGSVGMGQASPLYFTFDGEVSYIYDRYGTNVPGDAGLSRGSPLTYTFLVDFEAEGFYWSRGYRYPQQDRSYSYTRPDGTYRYSYEYDYFYTRYVGGDALTAAPYYTYDYYYGYNYDYSYWTPTYSYSRHYGYLYGESKLYVYDYLQTVEDWSVGKRLYSYDYWSEPRNGYLQGRLTLTSISDTNPYAIPEPATSLLLGPGLIGLVVLRRRLRG